MRGFTRVEGFKFASASISIPPFICNVAVRHARQNGISRARFVAGVAG
jgi:hypothetical protein